MRASLAWNLRASRLGSAVRPSPFEDGPERGNIEGSGIGTGTQIAVQSVDRGDFFVTQFETEDVDIGQQALVVLGLWNCDEAVLDVPAKNDLRGHLSVFLSQLDNRPILKEPDDVGRVLGQIDEASADR